MPVIRQILLPALLSAACSMGPAALSADAIPDLTPIATGLATYESADASPVAETAGESEAVAAADAQPSKLSLAASAEPGPTASSPRRPALNKKSTLSFYLENDLFVHTDRYYTNGARITWLSPDAETLWEDESEHIPAPALWLRDALDALSLRLGGNDQERWTHNIGLAVGQEIYTPDDITIRENQDDDRPWAGWTYVALSLHRKNEHKLHVLELSVGIVGDYSFAEQTQDNIHKMRDFDRPQGWHNQLDNEPGVILTYEQKRRYAWESEMTWLGADLIPYGSVSIGNVSTQAVLGSTVRIGYNLPHDFHSNRIRTAGYALGPNASEADVASALPGAISVYLFGGIEGKAIARDIFLDGNTFAPSHSVDKEPFVGEFEYGVGMRYRNFRAALTLVARTREFETQVADQRYGSISISYSY